MKRRRGSKKRGNKTKRRLNKKWGRKYSMKEDMVRGNWRQGE